MSGAGDDTGAPRHHDEAPVLGRRWVHLPAAVVFALLSIGSFSVFSGAIRQIESDVAGRLAGSVTGNEVRPIPGIGSMLVLRDGDPIIARVTYWCSLSTVLGSLFAGSALLAFGRRTPARRLALAIVAAVATVTVVNQLRLVSTAVSGRQWGGAAGCDGAGCGAAGCGAAGCGGAGGDLRRAVAGRGVGRPHLAVQGGVAPRWLRPSPA